MGADPVPAVDRAPPAVLPASFCNATKLGMPILATEVSTSSHCGVVRTISHHTI